MDPFVRRIKREMGNDYFVQASNERLEHLYVTKKGEFFNCPSKEELEPVIKEIFPDHSFNFSLRYYKGGFFNSMGSRDDILLTFNLPDEYSGHFVIFGNNNITMLALTRRGIYPTKEQQNKYASLIKKVYSQFYQSNQSI